MQAGGKFRTERDSMGELQVPEDALYGAQTQRAVDNFPISGAPMPAEFIHALALIKETAAEVNMELGLLNKRIGRAIVGACAKVRGGDLAAQFPVDVFQTGSGTSSNMNVNEVVATLAARACRMSVSANDHVNMCQSSNDSVPSAIHIAAVLEIRANLLPALNRLAAAIDKKARTLDKFVKTGRTHLMDAMPIRLSQELGGWAAQIRGASAAIKSAEPRLLRLAQGGTAVGTGINAHPKFAAMFCAMLRKKTKAPFRPAESFFAALASQDAAVEMSGQLKTTAVAMMKIANDLRWMNSGPLAGLGEIELEALQPGSSIMPGKVNPVIPEAAAMAAAQVVGNDAAITGAGQSGVFQLNVMLPLIARNLLESIKLLANSADLLGGRAIKSFRVKREKLEAGLSHNPILVTALNPVIGYLRAAEIAKRAYREGRPVLEVAAEETGLPKRELARLLNPAKLTRGGIQGE